VFISKKPYQEAEPTEGAQGEPAAAPAASAGSASASSSGSSGSPQFAAWIAAVKGWLEASDTSAQLGAPGLSTDGLIKLLESTDVSLRCLQRITANSPIDLMGSFFTLSLGEDSAGMQQEQHHDRDKQLGLKFVTSLGQLGSALAVLPLSCGCNNPLCRNLEGVGEEEGGGMQQGSLCAACRKVRYCSKACQKQQWKQHRVVCKALAEAAAATPSA
jgi:hypothetical protein